MHARTADAGVISTRTWLAIDVTIRYARVNQPFSTYTLSSMIDTIERMERERERTDEADGAVAESAESTIRERKRHLHRQTCGCTLANARYTNRYTKARWQEEWYWDGNLFVCSKSAPLNDISAGEWLDMRYWINGGKTSGARSASGFKSEGAVIAFSSESYFFRLVF